MEERFIATKYRTDCYQCKNITDQAIRAVPYQAKVVCSSCGGTRVFIPKNEDIAKPGQFMKPDCYPVWSLSEEALCRNCGKRGPHELSIGCRVFTVRCENCGFTHFYKFDLEYIAESIADELV